MRLVKATDVAKLLGVSEARVYELVREGLLPAVHLGRQIRFSEAALERFIAEPLDDRPNIYLFWSVERVAMLYDLKEIGGHDWYSWGARSLIARQRPDGAWHTQGYFGSQPTHDTAMAILFLTRSHLNRDLTSRLKGFVQSGVRRQ